jgi:hypothetical protein
MPLAKTLICGTQVLGLLIVRNSPPARGPTHSPCRIFPADAMSAAEWDGTQMLRFCAVSSPSGDAHRGIMRATGPRRVVEAHR